jgi:hypothetical protein
MYKPSSSVAWPARNLHTRIFGLLFAIFVVAGMATPVRDFLVACLLLSWQIPSCSQVSEAGLSITSQLVFMSLLRSGHVLQGHTSFSDVQKPIQAVRHLRMQ